MMDCNDLLSLSDDVHADMTNDENSRALIDDLLRQFSAV